MYGTKVEVQFDLGDLVLDVLPRYINWVKAVC